ncbi:MAG: sugar kinase, partial [Clostridiales bacterium]|nr:sugar kinase [Clostridiales bacterium]
MKKVVTFGEIMLRLCAEGEKRFVQTDNFGVCYAGAEANVAVALSCMNVSAKFVTALPDNELGQMTANALRKFGVDLSAVKTCAGRMGLMFFEKGAGQRASQVIYDRACSAMASAASADFDFDKIFDGAAWFHLTGITPALSPALAKICETAVKKAKDKRLTVSFDVNYRSKLWSVNAAAAVLPKIAKYADIIFASDWDAENIFGAADIVDLIAKCKLKAVAHTMRGSDGTYSGVLYKDGKTYNSKKHVLTVVDRI